MCLEGAGDPALEQREMALDRIGVRKAILADIFLRGVIGLAVTGEAMAEVAVNAGVIGHDVRGEPDMLVEDRPERLGRDVGDVKRFGAPVTLYPPLRVDAATEKLSRLIASRKLKSVEAADVGFMIPQIRLIAQARNSIMHMGYTKIEGNSFIFDNKDFILKSGRRKITVNVKTLNDMSADVVRICRHLWLILSRSRLHRPAY
jgi:hypothetical protein